MMQKQDLQRRLSAIDFRCEYGDLEADRARELKSAARLAYKLEGRQRRAARHLAERARKRGELIRGNFCENCGTVAPFPMHGHHPDHALPLSVLWLCETCHGLVDRHGGF